MTNRVTVEIVCDAPGCQTPPWKWIDNTCHLKESWVRVKQEGWQLNRHRAVCPACGVKYFLQSIGKTGAINVVPR